MARASMTMRLVTPVFAGGANPEGPPEVRMNAVKRGIGGSLRSVALALTSDVLAAAQFEERVTGSTRGASGVAVSGDLRTSLPLTNLKVLTTEHAEGAPGQDAGLGLGYLGYGLEKRRAFPADTSIAIELTTWAQPETLRLATGGLWLWANFGGLGARTRRGWGSLFADFPAAVMNFIGVPAANRANAHSYADTLHKGLAAVTTLVRTELAVMGIPITPLAAYTIAAPALGANTVTIRVDPHAHTDAATALDAAGNALRQFRTGATWQHEVALARMLVNLPPTAPPPADTTFTRAGFGLPHGLYFPLQGQPGRKLTVEAYWAAEHDEIKRRASPLHLRIVQLDDGWHALWLAWHDAFLPASAVLRAKGKTYPLPTTDVALEFLDYLNTGRPPISRLIEVKVP